MTVNRVTAELPSYPMETLARIKSELTQKSVPVYDFGTGDPHIPTWAPIRDAMLKAVPEISQYPSVTGSDALNQAIWGYLKRRFDLDKSPDLMILPATGSKESIFHIALCLVGRLGKKIMIYPNPGYPVYQSSTLYAGGVPYPVDLREENGYLLEPWTLPSDVQKNAAAIWINYPHNPTGAMAPESYFLKLIEWAKEHDVVILSDDCYTDIWDAAWDKDPGTNRHQLPINPIVYTHKNIISFMSLSKRSGMTGYRSGFMVGDTSIMKPLRMARANFGVATPSFVQAASVVAWNDDTHVAERRRIFSERIDLAMPTLLRLGIIRHKPDATFYLWCKIPNAWDQDDVKFCLELSEQGVITSPSQWISEGIKGYFRFALVPEKAETLTAMNIVEKFILKHR